MPRSAEQKKRSRQRILKSAFKLFTEQGFENTSIDQIMHYAGLTRGAFYAHFASKSDLYQQAILNAAAGSYVVRGKPQHLDNKAWIETLLSSYLSRDHVENREAACPLAFLTTDIATREPEVRNTYTKIYKKLNSLIHQHTQTYSNCSETNLLAVTAMMIGGVAISRALNEQETVDQVLEACKRAAQMLLSET